MQARFLLEQQWHRYRIYREESMKTAKKEGGHLLKYDQFQG